MTTDVPEHERHVFGPRRHRYCVAVFVINEGERVRNQLRAMALLADSIDIVVADGGSTDHSLDLGTLDEFRLRALLVKRGPGKLSAQMRMAIDFAMGEGYDGMVVIDGNGKDDVGAIPRFIALLDEGYDHIQGSRYVDGGEGINTPVSRTLGVKLLHAPLISLAAGVRYTDTTNGFRAYSRRLLTDPRVQPLRAVFSGYELHYYLAIRAARLGFRVTETPVTRRYPASGKTPTKISPIRGNLKVLRTLAAAVLGRFDPLMEFNNAALIGHTGFVGGNLARQHKFDDCFNSSNIEAVAGRTFDLIVCAGVPSEKWRANAEPDRDRQNIGRLMAALVRVEAARLVLISTVDVFKDPVEVDEESPISTVGLEPYGRNRRHLEEFVASHFDASIVRLPGLYGRGLKKNAIFDLLRHNQVEKVDSRGVFQFYGVKRLWSDIGIVLDEALPVAHLVTEPVSMQEVARAAFDMDFKNEVAAAPPHYDLRTRHAELFGGVGQYVETRAQVFERLHEYVAGERRGRG